MWPVHDWSRSLLRLSPLLHHIVHEQWFVIRLRMKQFSWLCETVDCEALLAMLICNHVHKSVLSCPFSSRRTLLWSPQELLPTQRLKHCLRCSLTTNLAICCFRLLFLTPLAQLRIAMSIAQTQSDCLL